MSARSKARKRALDVLYSSEMRRREASEALAEQVGAGQVNDYTATLVRGVAEHQARIDEVIGTYAEGWTLDRMPAIDRNVLRIGVFEVMYADDIPDAVAVSEAINLVAELSTDESPAFVNGVLGNVVRDKQELAG
ncbi:MAG: transcription antitermination factor NusB [Actinomycetota bacterium]|nr:transcription antitermination factor NusB [Actinomycetota bacterium]